MKMCLQIYIDLPDDVEAKAAMDAADCAAQSFAIDLNLPTVPEHEWTFLEMSARGSTAHGG